MAANEGKISIGFKIEAGKDGLQNLVVDARELHGFLEATVSESEKLSKSIINFAALSTSLDSVSTTLDKIQGAMKEYTSAYQAQVQAEQQLAQVMRNTMDAREEDIQSIKDYCSAQQQIGIIGDEVQLAGAQELATYLSLKGSLQSLIPVMNDMLAQQYGYSASAENASQIATMLGKVMEGQTGALSRYGYKFDEAQEKILKYGTESERVAVLAEVVGASVGGMNKKLAETPTGQMKQLENTLGDIKEKIGEYALMAEPYVTMASGIAITLLSLTKLYNGTVLAAKGIASLKPVVLATDKAMKLLGVSSKAAAVGIKGLLISSGVGVAIWALTEAVQYFIGKSDEAADAANRLTDAEKRAQDEAQRAKDLLDTETEARSSAVASLELYKSKLENFNGTKEEERKLVTELNNTYGSTMGYFKSVAEWYQALVSNSEAYCRQMVAEAKTRKMASQIADLEMKRDAIVKDEYGKARMYSTEKKKEKVRREDKDIYGNTIYMVDEVYGKSDKEKAIESIQDYNRQIAALKGNIKAAGQEAAKAMPVMGEVNMPDFSKTSGAPKEGRTKDAEIAPEGSIKNLQDKISDIDKKIKFSIDPDEIYNLERQKQAIQQQIHDIELPIRIVSTQKEWEKMIGEIPPISLDVKVNTDTLSKELKALPEGVKNTADLDKKLEAVGQTASQVGQAFSGMGQAFEMPLLDVAGMLAGAIATMIQGYATASSQASALGPFGWIGFAATGLATLTAMISQVKNLGAFASGGIVGGNSTSGDRVLVRVNSGEMILNARQQRNLFNMLNSASLPMRSADVPRLQPDMPSHIQPISIDVNVQNSSKVKGGDILTAGSNKKRIKSKSGHKYNGL